VMKAMPQSRPGDLKHACVSRETGSLGLSELRLVLFKEPVGGIGLIIRK
jgi:hypothetical protein